ncbi:alcohol dehydrogenase [Enterococcus florum]|uniref:Alcohol dehydrogenase n=1 Tax=Enterococcus florum TaxID=2480627 RepID=A0A4P5P7N4_9ENTE|nr:iron-containing alcohol dehydrogenase [Enterococcus florum]GCF93995.1 alcohol dehydrogenase [Enterococcus florum]
MTAHMPYRTTAPINFDRGIAKEVGNKLADAEKKKTLLLFDEGIEEAGISQEIAEYIKDAGIEVVENNQIQEDPPDRTINELAKFAAEQNVDSIVALGGGSAIDTAKGVSLLLTNGGKINDYLDRGGKQKPGIFLIAIPTTAGTGSESTRGAVVTLTEEDTKIALEGDGLEVDIALIDPELTLGVPPEVTAATGFDALSHALDGFISIKANAFTKYQSAYGVSLFRKSIKEVVYNGDNIEARTDMMAASAIGGLIITGASVSLIHSFAHSLGAVYHVPHGNSCAIFMPAVLEFVSEEKSEEIRWIADLFEVDYSSKDDAKEIARKTGRVIWQLAKEMGLSSITDAEAEPEKMYQIIQLAQEDPSTETSARKLDDAGAKWIIDRTYEVAKELEN